MKKIYLLFMYALWVLLLLSSCKISTVSSVESQNLQDNPFAQEQTEEVMYAYGFGLVSPDPETNMVYDGSPIEFEYFIDNGGASMSVGMLMFVNGIPQTYCVEGETEETYMHIQQSPANQKITVKASFSPVTGRQGDTLSVRFLSILNPKNRPEKLDYIYGHTNAMMTFFPRYIEMAQDSVNNIEDYPRFSEPREMTEEELGQVVYMDSTGRDVSLLKEFHFYAQRVDNPDLPYLDVSNHSLTVEIQGFGGPAGDYMLIPYINQVPVLNKDFPCVLTVAEGKQISIGEMTIDCSKLNSEDYQIGAFNTFYTVAVPVDGGTQFEPMISKSYVFEGD